MVAPRPAQDGVLEEAWLVGGGDPYLATPDYAAYLTTRPRTADTPVTPLTALADELVALGVRSIPAGLHTDETRYPPQRSVPTWKPSYVSEVGSLDCVTVDEVCPAVPHQKVAPDPAAAPPRSAACDRPGVSVPGAAAAAAPGPTESSRHRPLGALVRSRRDVAGHRNYAAEAVKDSTQLHGPAYNASGTARVVEELCRPVCRRRLHLNACPGSTPGPGDVPGAAWDPRPLRTPLRVLDSVWR